MGIHQSRGVTDFAYRWLSKRLVANVAVCDAASRQFQAKKLFSPVRSYVVPNGIDISVLKNVNVPVELQLRTQLNLKDDNILIGSIGRLTQVKAVERQIEVFASIADEFPLAHLIIVGDGQERKALEAIAANIKSRVHFLGKRSDIPAVLSQLDVFVQSSITEGHSIALLEAASAGVPVIVTDVGGNREIVQEAITGFLIKSFDKSAYVEALSKLLSNENLRKTLGTQAQQWATANATIQKMSESYFKIYNLNHQRNI